MFFCFLFWKMGYTGVGPTVDCSVEMWSSSVAVLAGAHFAGSVAGWLEVRAGAAVVVRVPEVEVEAEAWAGAEAGGSSVWETAAAAALGAAGGL